VPQYPIAGDANVYKVPRYRLYMSALEVSAKSADDCARIATLQSYDLITIRRCNHFRSVPIQRDQGS